MPLAPPELSILTERDAAKSLGISLGTLRRERMLGRIGFIRMSRRIIRYTEQNLIDYLAAREETSTGGTPGHKRRAGVRRSITAKKQCDSRDALDVTSRDLADRILGVRTRRSTKTRSNEGEA